MFRVLADYTTLLWYLAKSWFQEHILNFFSSNQEKHVINHVIGGSIKYLCSFCLRRAVMEEAVNSAVLCR